MTEYSYSPLDLVTHINYNGGKQVSYAYNKTGQLVRMDDWNGTTTFDVDLLKRITKTTNPKGQITGYTYDGQGNQTSITYPDHSVTGYEYDLLGRMTRVLEPENKVTQYHYDRADRLTSMLYPNGWEEFYHYDPAGRLLKVEETDPSNKDMKTIKHTYTYDPNGNKLSEYKRGNGTGSAREDCHYTYDDLNRITSAHENYGNVTRGYQYDTLGNLIYETQNGGNKFADRQYNSLNQLVYMSQDKSAREYMTYAYDARGNLLEAKYHKGAPAKTPSPGKGNEKNKNKTNKNSGKGNGSDKGNNQNNNGNKEGLRNASYIYDETNQMVQGKNGAGEIALYTRDGLGNLIGNEWIVEKNAYGYHGFDRIPPSVPTLLKKHETVKKNYVLNYTSPLKDTLMEQEEDGLTYRYGYGAYDHRLSVKVSPVDQAAGAIMENGAVNLYYHTDDLGTTDYLTSDKTGKVVSWTMYNEWGEITHNAVLKCGHRELDLVKNYTGYEYDPVLDLYFAKARMYDATNHRFTQIDPIQDGDNWYAYTGNNPVNWNDPQGLARRVPLDGGATTKKTKPEPEFKPYSLYQFEPMPSHNRFHPGTATGNVVVGGTDKYPIFVPKFSEEINGKQSNSDWMTQYNALKKSQSKDDKSKEGNITEITVNWIAINWASAIGGFQPTDYGNAASFDDGRGMAKASVAMFAVDAINTIGSNTQDYIGQVSYWDTPGKGAVVQLGMRFNQVQQAAGSYFDALDCESGDIDFMQLQVAHEIAEKLNTTSEYADLRYYWSKNRVDDSFFYYVFVNGANQWRGLMKKYKGDSVRVQEYKYNWFPRTFTPTTSSDYGSYDEQIIIPDKVKKGFSSKLEDKGITLTK